MGICSKVIFLPDPLAVDAHFGLDGHGRVDPPPLSEIQNHDENVGDLPIYFPSRGIDHFSNFPVQLEEHRLIGTIGEGLVGPFLDVNRKMVDIH
jgi:hypothetical protein